MREKGQCRKNSRRAVLLGAIRLVKKVLRKKGLIMKIKNIMYVFLAAMILALGCITGCRNKDDKEEIIRKGKEAQQEIQNAFNEYQNKKRLLQ